MEEQKFFQLSRFENTVRLLVYRYFAEHGEAPDVKYVAKVLVCSEDEAEAAFRSLARKHVLVLFPDTTRIWMAMPFSAVQTSFRVTAGPRAWWAN